MEETQSHSNQDESECKANYNNPLEEDEVIKHNLLYYTSVNHHLVKLNEM